MPARRTTLLIDPEPNRCSLRMGRDQQFSQLFENRAQLIIMFFYHMFSLLELLQDFPVREEEPSHPGVDRHDADVDLNSYFAVEHA